MAKLTKKQIEALNGVSEDDKTSILELFTSANDAEAEVQRLRKSQPKDSEMVVQKTDHAAMQAAVAERDTKISALEQKLASLQIIDPAKGEDAGGFLDAFEPVMELFDAFFGDASASPVSRQSSTPEK